MASGKFGVGSTKEAVSESFGWKRYARGLENKGCVPIFKGKGDVMDCGAYGGVKLLEHAMRIVERVPEKRISESR